MCTALKSIRVLMVLCMIAAVVSFFYVVLF